MKPQTHPAKLAGAGILAALALVLALAAAPVRAASVAITNARNSMHNADYASMVTTLDAYLAANPSASDAQEARLLRAIGRAGTVVKNNTRTFLIQKGATAATLDLLNHNSTVEFPMRPKNKTGKAWTKNGNNYSLPAPANNSWANGYLLAWANTGATARSFDISVTPPASTGIYYGCEIILNGDYIGYIYDNTIQDYNSYGWPPVLGPDFPISNVIKNTNDEITRFTVTLQPGQWLTLDTHVSNYSGGDGGDAVTLAPAAALPDGITVSTGTVPYDGLPDFAAGTNFADIIAFLGDQQGAFDNIIADLTAIQPGFSTTFSTAETGIAGTLQVQYADAQMLIGLFKSAQALHRFLKTYNFNADISHSTLIDNYTSTLTGDFRADDFIMDYPDLLRPAAGTGANADCKQMKTLLSAAIDILLNVEETLFSRQQPADGHSYLFAADSDRRTDYHVNLSKLRDALTGFVDFENNPGSPGSSHLLDGGKGTFAPLFTDTPLDLRNLFEISPRGGIKVGGSENFLSSGLIADITPIQWENYLNIRGWPALGGKDYGYYYSYSYSYDGTTYTNIYSYPGAGAFNVNIERGAPSNLPYYPAGVFGTGAAAFSKQWKLYKGNDNDYSWYGEPVFENIAGAGAEIINLALVNDADFHGAYPAISNAGAGEVVGGAGVYVNWFDAADFDPAFTITRSPLSQTFRAGETINLWVGTSSISKDMRYQWYKNNQLIASATTALHTIPVASAADAGNYHVIISNSAVPSARSDTARLVTPVSVASVTVSPESVTVVKSATQQFTATVTGSGGTTLAPNVTWNVTASGGGTAGAGTNINTAGLLTVATAEPVAALTVRAVSIIDTSKSGAATVTLAAPSLTIDKTVLTLAQTAYATGTLTVSANTAWAVQTDAASWLAAEPLNGGAGSTTVTLRAIAGNTTGASRDASVTVNGGGLARTVFVTQADAAAGTAPTALTPGATLTLTQGALTETFTVLAGNQLAPAAGASIPYGYSAAGNTATLLFDDTLWTLNFGNNTFRATDTGTYATSTGAFAIAPPAPGTHVLTVVNGIGSGAHTAGATVTLTANAAPSGKIFDRWTSSAGGTFANASAATTTFTMPAADTTVTANYKDPSTNPGGGGGGGGGGAPMLPGLALLAALLALRARWKQLF
jgi:hypothetical protein